MRVIVAIGALLPAVASAQAWDPLDADGWPRGYTVVQLRHLPECGPEGLPHEPGHAIHCRPRIAVGPLQWSLGADWTSGATFGDVPTSGASHGIGIEGGLAVLRNVQIGGRYEALMMPADGERQFSHHFLGQLKLRLFTDEVTREAWTLGGGYGVALRGDVLGGDAPIVRVALAREAALDLQRPRTAMIAAIELAYEHSLDDARLDTALASVRLGFETQLRPARNLGEPAPSPWRRTTSIDLIAPAGGGVSFGLRANDHLSLETSASYTSGVDGTELHGFRDAVWAIQSGPRVQLVGWPADWAPGYVQLQGGIGWIAQDPGVLRAVQTAEVGVRALCSRLGFDLGAWIRTNLAADRELAFLDAGLALRIVLGTSPRALGGQNTHCGATSGEAAGALVLRGPPRNDPTPTTGSTSTTYTIGVPALPNVDVPKVALPTAPPPPSPPEVVAPRAGFVWIAGHWEWRGGWAWVAGHWERERANQRWIPGSWQQQGGVYIWIEGRWER